jgi:DNA-binding transcriptional LysR family regulator
LINTDIQLKAAGITMDIELAKTFLEIMSAGTFLEASERLHVTQTTITARISKLEEILGSQLFIRNRSGAKLTQEGERFVEYANALVQLWSKAQAEFKLPAGKEARLCIGGETSLWNPIMSDWACWIQDNLPAVILHADVSDPETLMARLERSTLDIIIVHKPNYHSAFVVKQILEEKLIQVQATHQSQPNMFVDWGDTYRGHYDASLPQPRQQGFSSNFGPLALKVMLKNGGNGYFRTRVVRDYIEQGLLEQVPDSPEFSYPIYVMYRKGSQSESIMKVLNGLRECMHTSLRLQV